MYKCNCNARFTLSPQIARCLRGANKTGLYSEHDKFHTLAKFRGLYSFHYNNIFCSVFCCIFLYLMLWPSIIIWWGIWKQWVSSQLPTVQYRTVQYRTVRNLYYHFLTLCTLVYYKYVHVKDKHTYDIKTNLSRRLSWYWYWAKRTGLPVKTPYFCFTSEKQTSPIKNYHYEKKKL